MNQLDDHPGFSSPPFKVEYRDDSAVQQLSRQLTRRLRLKADQQDVVIICIGTDRSTGDSLGPLVGSKLQAYYPKHFHVYGTLEEPVHAVNLQEKLEMIEQRHPDRVTIAIDACLGQYTNVGSINVADGPLKPGAGVKKELPAVGSFHITGIVNVGGFMEYFVLQNTRLFVVMQMSEVIAKALFLTSIICGKDHSGNPDAIAPELPANQKQSY
ncbi:spore protease YyaC [Brevibacillus humidisoli]|uniref:spore protease YyaC n=1 Tax=Brevibacillus humidisoli TaxID=2895522 RepID=UPI001E60181C|nr:spore protease YyaC [Brevibacillus humidisoli]UFJ40435.1 spore protease YyaC [Brevibacillus humidisoli]